MSKTRIQFIISLIFLTGYLGLLGMILYAELSDDQIDIIYFNDVCRNPLGN